MKCKFNPFEKAQITQKNVGVNPAGWPRVYGARLKKFLSREFWYTCVCVGSNPTPVTKRFEHNKAEPSVDKFCHTGTLIQDDSPKQKTKKNRNVIRGR